MEPIWQIEHLIVKLTVQKKALDLSKKQILFRRMDSLMHLK